MNFITYCENFSTGSAFFRLLIAALLGGLIGIQRGTRRRPAGLRTFSLVSLGAALSMVTNEFLMQRYGTSIDPTRLAAQVISGIGFLGIGTIIITGKNSVRGLTTAATLWVTATMGIAIGAGFIIGGVAAFILIMLNIGILTKISRFQEQNNRMIGLSMEIDKNEGTQEVLQYIHEHRYIITSLEKNRKPAVVAKASVILLELDMKKRHSHDELIQELNQLKNVYYVEEIC